MCNFEMIGVLGSDPIFRTGASGRSYCDLQVIRNNPFNRKQRGSSYFVRVFDRTDGSGGNATNCKQYLAKRSRVQVKGRVVVNEWTDNAGEDHRDLRLNANYVEFLYSPPREASEPKQGEMLPAPGTTEQTEAAVENTAPQATGTDNFDDDIPF